MSQAFNFTDYNLLIERIAQLEYLIQLHENGILENKNGVDTAWVANCTYLVFLMQCGFSLLEAGTARYKNYVSALIKNCLDITISTIFWWLWGYAFAFGESKGEFIGTTFFAGDEINTFEEYNAWLFQWAFAGTAATIVSGCILERAKVFGYCIFSAFMTSWIYPLIVHWCWNDKGWLKDMGYIDFAGSGVVHMVGGTAGLFAAIMVGSRRGRFTDDNKDDENGTKNKVESLAEYSSKEFKHTYMPFVVLGTLMLWYSWYGFNCGSTVTISGDNTNLIGKIGMNTSISAAAGGFTCFMFNYFYVSSTKKVGDQDYEIYSMTSLCNGILAGLVGITAGCDAVASWAAFVIGIIAAFIYIGYNKLISWLKIDDPLDACPIHMGAGSWGVVAVGWFHTEKGILYGESAKLFGVNLLGVVVIFAWTGFWTIACFYVLKCFDLHRLSEKDEETGIDTKYCGGYAIHYDKVSRRHYSFIFAPENRKKSIVQINEEYNKDVEDEIVKEKNSFAKEMQEKNNNSIHHEVDIVDTNSQINKKENQNNQKIPETEINAENNIHAENDLIAN